MFQDNEIVTLTLIDRTGEDEVVIGTEQAQIIGASPLEAGKVWVRPLHGDDVIKVWVGDLSKVV